MRKCPEKQLISEMLDNELESHELSSINSHIKGCVECKKYFDELLEAEQNIRNKIRIVANNPELKSSIMDKVKQSQVRDLSGRHDRLQAMLKKSWVAASALVTIIVFWIVLFTNTVTTQTNITFQAASEDSFVEGLKMSTGFEIELAPTTPVFLSGDFIFTVPASITTQIQLEGDVKVQSGNNFLLEFELLSEQIVLKHIAGIDIAVLADGNEHLLNQDSSKVIESYKQTDQKNKTKSVITKTEYEPEKTRKDANKKTNNHKSDKVIIYEKTHNEFEEYENIKESIEDSIEDDNGLCEENNQVIEFEESEKIDYFENDRKHICPFTMEPLGDR